MDRTMELEVSLSEAALRERFVAGEPPGDERVRVRVDPQTLRPLTRAVLFDTFGPGLTRVAPDVLRVDRIPSRDLDFWLLAIRYRTAHRRRHWRGRLGIAGWVTLGIVLVLLFTLPVLDLATRVLIAIAICIAILVFFFAGT
jgi:hypothetical protein